MSTCDPLKMDNPILTVSICVGKSIRIQTAKENREEFGWKREVYAVFLRDKMFSIRCIFGQL